MCTKWLIMLTHYIFLPSILINFMVCLHLHFIWEFFSFLFSEVLFKLLTFKVFHRQILLRFLFASKSQTLIINSHACVQTCVSSHILLTWRPSSKPSPGTAVGGEPRHPKESEPRQDCLRCCSHLHSFKGYRLYNDIKFQHKILTRYRAHAILCYIVLNQSVRFASV